MKKNNKIIFAILITGLIIRLLGINQGLWHDEAIAAETVKNFSLIEYFNNFLPGDFHPPLYYLIQKTLYTLFGGSEFVFRLPGIISGVLVIYFVYLISVITIKDKKLLYWPAILCCISPILIQYSFESRPYSLAALVTIINVYLLLKIKNKFSSVLFIFYLLSFVILIYLNYLSYFYLIISMIAMIKILNDQKIIFNRLIIYSSLISIFLTIGIVPILKDQLSVALGISETTSGWQKIIGSQNFFKNIIQFFVKIISGSVDFDHTIFTAFMSGSSSMLILSILPLMLILKGKKNLLNIIFLITFALIELVSIIVPIYAFFRLLYLVPLIFIIITLFLEHFSKAKYVFYYLFISSIVFNFIYFLNPIFWREDWKGAAEYTGYLIANYQDSIVIFPTAVPYEAYFYYNNAPAIGIGDNFIVSQLTEKQEFELKKHKHLIFYDYLTELTDPKRITKNFLDDNYNEITGYSFNKIGSVRIYRAK